MSAESLPSLSEQELELIARTADLASDWHDLSEALESAAAARDSQSLRLVSMAFVYLLREADHGRGSVRQGGPYGLMLETGEGTFPPRPSETAEPVRALWRQTAEILDSPVVRSRLLDLLYVAVGPRAHADGRAAAEAFEEVAQRVTWSQLDRAQCMARALDIARELNDRAGAKKRGPIAVELASELLASEHPGPPFIVLRALTSLPSAMRPTALEALIDRAAERFAGTDHHVAALDLCVEVTNDTDRRCRLREQQVDVLEANADAAEGLVQATALRRAAEFAEAHGLPDRARGLNLRLQSLQVEGFERIEAQVELPAELLKQEVETTAGSGADDLAMALRLIGEYGPPGGSQADIDELVARQRAEHVFLEVLQPVLLEAGTSIPLFIAHDEASRQAMAVGRHRTFVSDAYGALLIARMLQRAVEHHGRPSHAELSELWTTSLLGAERGERMARALELFWDDQPDEAAHVLVPRLESALRDLAAATGMLVRKKPKPGVYGGTVSLGPIMEYLRDITDDDDWVCHLQALLCDPLSLNLRNAIAHGIAPGIGSVHAALLLQAACWLLRVQLPASAEPVS